MTFALLDFNTSAPTTLLRTYIRQKKTSRVKENDDNDDNDRDDDDGEGIMVIMVMIMYVRV